MGRTILLSGLILALLAGCSGFSLATPEEPVTLRYLYIKNVANVEPLPAYQQPFNVATLDGYFIFAESAHPEEAWLWIQFLMQQPTASGVLVPPLQSMVDSPEYAARAAPASIAVARSLPSQIVLLGMEMFRNQCFGQVLNLYSQAAVKVFKGEKDAQAALDDAQKQAEDIFR